MRVVDEWTKEDLRITVFMMNGRYSIKAEKNLLEQTFKFRDGQIDNISHLKSLLSDEFYSNCQNQFIHMDLNKARIFPSNNSDENFVEII